METIELEIYNDFTITVIGTFDEWEKGDRNHPDIAPSFTIDEYSADDTEYLEDYKTQFKGYFLSHLEDLCLKQLLA